MSSIFNTFKHPLLFIANWKKYFCFSLPTDTWKQTDDCFVMHRWSPSRGCNTNIAVIVTVINQSYFYQPCICAAGENEIHCTTYMCTYSYKKTHWSFFTTTTTILHTNLHYPAPPVKNWSTDNFVVYSYSHAQSFNGPMSVTARLSQKKQSPTHTHPDHQTYFVNFLHQPRS